MGARLQQQIAELSDTLPKTIQYAKEQLNQSTIGSKAFYYLNTSGNSNIPPALIIIGQVAMGSLAGFWGVLLATPVVAILMRLINKLYVDKQ